MDNQPTYHFKTEKEELIWAQEQIGLLWEFIEKQQLLDEVDDYIKENTLIEQPPKQV